MSRKQNTKLVVKATDLSYTYPGSNEPAVDDLNFQLATNTINMVIGPNGSGKSTLIKLIIGTIQGQGNISFLDDGQEISRSSAHIGYVPQNNVIDGSIPITVNEFLVLTQQSCNRCHNHTGDEVKRVLTKVNAASYQYKKLGDLSGGQLQRVILARALLNHPKILILDEPESGIDFQGEKYFYEVLKDLVKNENMTALVATHEMEIVSEYADQVLCLKKTLVCTGSVSDTLTQATFKKLYGVHAVPYNHDHSTKEKGST